MRMVAEYLEHAVHFEQMAAQAIDEELKDSLLAQARAYHQLAAEHAALTHQEKERGTAERQVPETKEP